MVSTTFFRESAMKMECVEFELFHYFTRYYPGSFLASPGWVQVKCDLRLLSQFPFILNPEWELPANKKNVNRLPLKEGVRDMLVKHHLFSWDL